MDFFDKHKALIITCLFFSVLLLGLYNLSLSSNNKKARELLVDLDNFRTEKPEEQKEPEPEEIPPPTNRQTAQTHRAFNESQQAREENFDRQLQEIFEKNSAAREESTEETESAQTSGSFNFKPKAEETKKRSDGNRATTNTSTKSGGMDNSSISFNLLGRNAVDIPNPIYTCSRAGTIVVNIRVDERGRVTATSINKAASSSNNDCLTEQALYYASRALFSPLAGKNDQPGNITYRFKP